MKLHKEQDEKSRLNYRKNQRKLPKEQNKRVQRN